MSKDSSAKYYQKSKEMQQNKTRERCQILSEEEEARVWS